ncbi:CHAT domain-containing protein [Taibaiella koreensis]|uniref:CHAT domain-containing protein n=1 Tax=Taibaiella koreensis TaxID=1268548 RepID=UPI0013C2E219|nr:CHAT domain-containing protein [Taibaiella koreensis]
MIISETLPYEQAVDTLSTFRTYKELYGFFEVNENLLDQNLLDELELRRFQTEDAGQQIFYSGLAKEIHKLFCKKTLVTFVNMDADDAIAFFYDHYQQLVHEEAHNFFPQIMDQVAANKDMQTLVSIKELMLTQLIADHFLFKGDRYYRYHVLLKGLVWLGKPAAKDCFTRAAAIDEQWRNRASQLSTLVSECETEGALARLYHEIGPGLEAIAKAGSEESMKLSQVLLEIAGDAHRELSALLYANIGNQLRTLGVQGDRRTFWNAVFAYRESLKLYSLENDAEGVAQCHRNLGELFFDTAFGDRDENRMTAIAALGQALAFFTPENKPETYAGIHYKLGDLYRDLKTEAYAEHMELGIEAYRKALQHYTRGTDPGVYGDIQNSLGTIYLERIRENPIEKTELAITALLAAREVIDPVSEPDKWSTTANNLGKAYARRTKGVKADNQERAINYYREALAVPEAPAFRSVAMQNLGCLFRDRIQGDKNENLEEAKEYLEDALAIRTEDLLPLERGNTLTNLGAVLMERLSGNRIENIEKALEYETQAAAIFARMKRPVDWALAQRNLVVMYRERFRGDAAENNERSLRAVQEALTVYTAASFPQQWAELQKDIALSYQKRQREEKKQNIIAAMAAIDNALGVFSSEYYPSEWAECQSIKGNLLMSLSAAEGIDHIEQALEAFRLSALWYKEAGDDIKWAQVQHDMGIAYYRRKQGAKNDNLKAAIEAYRHVIRIFNKDYFREALSNIYNNLGSIYSGYEDGNTEDNIKTAIDYYQQSLLLRTLEEFPQQRRDTAWNFGNFLYRLGRWEEAIAVFSIAHEAIQATRNDSKNIESLARIAKENAEMYRKLVTCHRNINAIEGAAKYALLGKARTLAELQGEHQAWEQLKASDPALAAGFLEIEQKQTLLDEALALLQYEKKSKRLPAEKLEVFEQEQKGIIARFRHDISRGYDELLFKHPELSAFRALPDFSVADLQAVLHSWHNMTLVEYVQHDQGYTAFLFRDNKIASIDLSPELMSLLGQSVEDIVKDEFWKSPAGSEARLRQMHDLLITPIAHLLPPDGPVMIAPTTFLHLLPFQAFLSPEGQYLSERFAITFVPGTIALLAVARRAGQARPACSSLLTVAHSGYGARYLKNVLLEVEAISQSFEQTTNLHEEAATAENIITRINGELFDVIHFSCHGLYSIQEPGQSGLVIANENILTVNEIRTKLSIKGNPLVSLSACQTGQIKPEFGDESIGIAWSFLTAGASTVLASQWSVPDEETRILFDYFYWIRKQTNKSYAECLQQAIAELRSNDESMSPARWAAFHTIGLPL